MNKVILNRTYQRLLLILLLSFWSQVAGATGFNFWESSAINSSLASANGAIGFDSSILALAPSSMTLLKRRQISFNLTHYAVSTDYQIFSQSAEYRAADPIPSGFVVLPINQHWNFGLGIYSRTAADISVPRIPLLNPDEVRIRPIFISVAPSLAYQFGSLSIAATLEYIHADYGFDRTSCNIFGDCSTTQLEDSCGGWSGGLSATWLASNRFSIALAHQFPSNFSDENMKVALPSITRVYLTTKLLAGLDWHQNYSYSQWQDKGIIFSDYPDHLGLFVGQENSNRYATSLDYQINQFRLAVGFSVDQAIDAFGGDDYRYRLGGGYQFTPDFSLDLSFFYEQYASKKAEINGQPVVQVQNRGNGLGLGLRYIF